MAAMLIDLRFSRLISVNAFSGRPTKIEPITSPLLFLMGWKAVKYSSSSRYVFPVYSLHILILSITFCGSSVPTARMPSPSLIFVDILMPSWAIVAIRPGNLSSSASEK